MTTTVTTTPAPTYNYQAKHKCITIQIETNLESKLEVAIDKLQQSVATFEQKFDQKLNQQIKQLEATQTDKAMQETHTCKHLSYLVSKISILVDLTHHLMPVTGARHP